MKKILLLSLVAGATLSAAADDLTFVGGVSNADNIWSTTATVWQNASGGIVAWKNGSNAIFNSAAAQAPDTIIVNGDITYGSITFDADRNFYLKKAAGDGAVSSLTGTGTILKKGAGTVRSEVPNSGATEVRIEAGLLDQHSFTDNFFNVQKIVLDGGAVGFCGNYISGGTYCTSETPIEVTSKGGAIYLTRYAYFKNPLSGDGPLTFYCGGERTYFGGKMETYTGTVNYLGDVRFETNEIISNVGWYGPMLNTSKKYDAASPNTSTEDAWGFTEVTLGKNVKLYTEATSPAMYEIGGLNAEEGSVIGGYYKDSNPQPTLRVGTNDDKPETAANTHTVASIFLSGKSSLYPLDAKTGTYAQGNNNQVFNFIKTGYGIYNFTGVVPAEINVHIVGGLEVEMGTVVVNAPCAGAEASVLRSTETAFKCDAGATLTLKQARVVGGIENAGTLNTQYATMSSKADSANIPALFKTAVTLKAGSTTNLGLSGTTLKADELTIEAGAVINVVPVPSATLTAGQKVTILTAPASTVPADLAVTALATDANKFTVAVERDGNAVSIVATVGDTWTVSDDPSVNAIQDVLTHGEPVAVEYYDINGRRLQSPAKGINIMRTIHKDGTAKTERIIK